MSEQKKFLDLNDDLLKYIFSFLSLRTLRFITSHISKEVCSASLQVQKQIWKKPFFTYFDGVIFDTTTGEIIHLFDDEDLGEIFEERRPTILYTKVPFQYQVLSSSTSTHEMSKNVKTHGASLAMAHEEALGYKFTNDYFQLLNDGPNFYFLYGNNLACFNFLKNAMIWRSKLYPVRRPMYVFVNFFFQNKDYIYVVLPTELIVFSKKDGTQSVIITPKMLKKKERIKHFAVVDKLLVVLYGETIISQEEFNIDKLMERLKSEKIVETTDIMLDKPKIYTFDKGNNYLVSANLKEDDLHVILKPKKSNVFCFISKSDQKLRVVNEEAEKIHEINYSSNVQLQQVTNYFFFYGDAEKKNFEIIIPEKGVIVQFIPDRELVLTFLVETDSIEIDGIIGVTKEKNSEVIFYKYNAKEKKFDIKWKSEIKWKTTYIDYDQEGAKFLTTNNHLFIARTCTDNRRFLSATTRLDIEIACYSIHDGKKLWERLHECSFDTDEKVCENGYDLSMVNDQLVARSYVFDGFDGSSCMVSYQIDSGKEIIKYNNRKTKINGKIQRSFIQGIEDQNLEFKVIKFEEKDTRLSSIDETSQVSSDTSLHSLVKSPRQSSNPKNSSFYQRPPETKTPEKGNTQDKKCLLM